MRDTANTCPLCGQVNECAMELERKTGVKQAPCWCTTVMFDAALLARLPLHQKNLTCICAKCAQNAAAEEALLMELPIANYLPAS
jgi:Cysteine-rich CWC